MQPKDSAADFHGLHPPPDGQPGTTPLARPMLRESPPLIHIIVVTLVIAARHVVHPLLVVKVPAHGFLYAFLELQARLPAQLALQLARVDGIAHIVALAVGHVGYQVHVLTVLAAEQSVDGLDDNLYDVYVLPLVEAADVVRVGSLAVVENQVDGAGVVFHVEPVAHVLALAVDGQRLAVAYVVDEQWDEFLRELVRPVVVRAVCHHGRHAVCVVESTDEMVGACFRRGIRRVRVVLRILGEELAAVSVVVFRRGFGGERRLHAVGVGKLQRAVHLVGRDMVKFRSPCCSQPAPSRRQVEAFPSAVWPFCVFSCAFPPLAASIWLSADCENRPPSYAKRGCIKLRYI